MTFIINWNKPRKDEPLKVMKHWPKIKEFNKRKYDLVDLSKVWLGRSEDYKKEMKKRGLI